MGLTGYIFQECSMLVPYFSNGPPTAIERLRQSLTDWLADWLTG